MKKHVFLLVLVLFVASLVRLYKFSAPVADWHSWRQADTSSVSREFVENGFDLLHPRYHDLSNVPSGKDNPQGYRFVEFPIYNTFQAGGYVLLNIFTLVEWGRIITIFSSLFSCIFLYLLVNRHASRFVALTSAFFFAFLPFNVYYGRTILPDPMMVTATLGAVYFFDKWLDGYAKRKEQRAKYSMQNILLFLLAAVFASSALLLKPFAIFFFLPMVVLAYNAFGFSLIKKWLLYGLVLLAIAPLLLWRWWMLQYPEGIPVSDWLFNGGDIRFKGAFFYWIFADRIGRLILGYFGVALLVLGTLAVSSKEFVKERKDILFFFSFLLSSILYLIVVARGNVQHDYYQIPIIPSLAIFLGFGATVLLKPERFSFNKTISYLLLTICVSFTFVFSWYHVRDYFNINNPNIVVAGEAVDKLTPYDAKVITFYDGDTSFLYQTNRKGWTSLQSSLPEMIRLGATHLVIVNPTEKDFLGLGTEYEIVAKDPRYLILKLQ